MPTHTDAVVIGAGLAGLSAAVHLHQAGLATVVCEAGDEVGGRVRTDRRDGFLLDRGFQVLLPAYPELGRQVDLAALDLRPFLRGLLKTTDTERTWLAAPWHSPQAAAGTVGFVRGHPRDSLALAAVSLRDVLAPGPRLSRSGAGTSTLTDLRSRVSEATFTSVLRPFLAGVFLDPSLGTSATLFHLIWRCFLRGGAALPAGGMQMLPRLLASGLPDGAVRTGTEVTQIDDAGVRTSDGEQIQARVVIIATDGSTAAALAPWAPGVEAPAWHPVTTFYYRVPASPLGAPVLVIDGDGGPAAQRDRAQRRRGRLRPARHVAGRRLGARPRGPGPGAGGPDPAGPDVRHRHCGLGAAGDLPDTPRPARPARRPAAGPPGPARAGPLRVRRPP